MADIFGDDFDNILFGVAGEINYIFGLGGNDTLYGSDYQEPTAESSRFGGIGGDLLRGGAGDDLLYGGGGDDTLYGDDGSLGTAVGNDQLFGGDGNDFLRGGQGLDYFDGGAGFDRISLYHLNATQAAYASLKDGVVYNDGYGNTEYFVNVEGLGQGTVFADTFEGDNGENYFLVDTGDVLTMLGGDDFVQVSGAPALIDGGSGTDTIVQFISSTNTADTDGDGFAEFLYTTNGVIVDLSLKSGQLVDDGFGNSGDIRKVENVGGSAFADIITGDNKDNAITGYLGADVLTGGKGRDVFIYENATDSDALTGALDTITDFDDKKDTIDLSGLADESLSGTLSFTGSAFTGAAGDVAVFAMSGTSLVAVDLDGDFLPDLAINVAGDEPLAGNFIL